MALTFTSSGGFSVTSTANGNLSNEYQIKYTYTYSTYESSIYYEGNLIERVYLGKTPMKEIVLSDEENGDVWLYYKNEGTSSIQGSNYSHCYVGIARDSMNVNSTSPVISSVQKPVIATGFRFYPNTLRKINTTNHTTSTGYLTDLSIDLYYGGAELYKAWGAYADRKYYMYYLNDYLIAVYNLSNFPILFSQFGAEIPYELRSYYLPDNTLIFVCDRSISEVGSIDTSSLSPDYSTDSNVITASISSTLDPVVFKDDFRPQPAY